MESTPGEDAVKITGMTTRNLEYPTNLTDITAGGFGRTAFNFERCSTVGKMLPDSITC